jgi:hypothetical protein
MIENSISFTIKRNAMALKRFQSVGPFCVPVFEIINALISSSVGLVGISTASSDIPLPVSAKLYK